MSRDDQIAMNLAIAEKFFDGYHSSVARGRLQNVFEKEDFAEEWVFCSPFLGGEVLQSADSQLAEGAVANHALISQKIPDYKMDDFQAWPTERGCAWRWRVNGNGLDGKHYEFWEQLFVWTNATGKITRFEFYDDWHGFPQTLVYAYGTSLDEFTKIEHYGAAPWHPGTAMTIHPPATSPRADPPANERVARNFAVAQRFFDGYHQSVARGRIEGVFEASDFADRWVLFSPWLGERQQQAGEMDFSTVADVEHTKIWQRLPDYKMDDFEAWPTETGCAWRWRVNGHAADGTSYEFWEQCFTHTDADGKITRFEFFDDWQGFPQTLGFITGLSVDDLWDAQNYQAWLAQSA
jgi:hypothetical protein